MVPGQETAVGPKAQPKAIRLPGALPARHRRGSPARLQPFSSPMLNSLLPAEPVVEPIEEHDATCENVDADRLLCLHLGGAIGFGSDAAPSRVQDALRARVRLRAW